MMTKTPSIIKHISAMQVISDRARPAIETTVITENGACGVAVAAAGISIGEHEVKFIYDSSEKWKGLGVLKGVKNVNDIIAPALKGKDATNQKEIDDIMIQIDGTPNKARLGGNAIASVSAAVLQAAAASINMPLYRYIGGMNARTLPVPGVIVFVGSTRYGGGRKSGGKPSYSFMCYGFESFSAASYACWEIREAFSEVIYNKFKVSLSGLIRNRFLFPAGTLDNDWQLWGYMLEAIEKTGQIGRTGIQVDVAASTFYDKNKKVFVGLFSKEDKTRDDLIEIYKKMVRKYPFVIIEDPLDEEDYEGHALLTKELGIQVVGDDIFTTNIERLQHGIEIGACNTLLLKVNQIGTISEAFQAVKLAHSKGYGVMPCSSRGEGPEIADYAVGLGVGTIRECGLDSNTNRFLKIGEELGKRGKFAGHAGLKFGPPSI